MRNLIGLHVFQHATACGGPSETEAPRFHLISAWLTEMRWRGGASVSSYRNARMFLNSRKPKRASSKLTVTVESAWLPSQAHSCSRKRIAAVASV